MLNPDFASKKTFPSLVLGLNRNEFVFNVFWWTPTFKVRSMDPWSINQPIWPRSCAASPSSGSAPPSSPPPWPRRHVPCGADRCDGWATPSSRATWPCWIAAVPGDGKMMELWDFEQKPWRASKKCSKKADTVIFFSGKSPVWRAKSAEL